MTDRRTYTLEIRGPDGSSRVSGTHSSLGEAKETASGFLDDSVSEVGVLDHDKNVLETHKLEEK